ATLSPSLNSNVPPQFLQISSSTSYFLSSFRIRKHQKTHLFFGCVFLLVIARCQTTVDFIILF
ncbi:MAG: hypothetical protein IKQ27_16825, partial [Lachnospiraceae bacterium]|nr:hypothetical protein [Lachnospiraceae bacterium]